MMQHAAIRCNTLHHAQCHLLINRNTPQHTATHHNTQQRCNTLHHAQCHLLINRNTPQHTTTHNNTLQHTLEQPTTHFQLS